MTFHIHTCHHYRDYYKFLKKQCLNTALPGLHFIIISCVTYMLQYDHSIPSTHPPTRAEVEAAFAFDFGICKPRFSCRHLSASSRLRLSNNQSLCL